MINPKYFR